MFHLPALPTITAPDATPIVPPLIPSGPPPYIETRPSQPAVGPKPVSGPQPATPPVVAVMAEQKVRDRSKSPTGFVDFLWQLFDVRVEKYLTLYIVRMYWILALFAVALFLVGIVLSLVLEGPRAAFRAPTSEDSLLQMLGQPRQSTSEYANVLQAYDRFKWFSLKLIFGISSILMVRVWCEMLVVAFNIANSLKSIDEKIDALDRKD
jgi:hypothetical protein